MELRKGYKQTEIGIFPQDWDTQSLIHLAERKKELFDDGDWIESEHITDEGIRLVQTGNLGEGKFIEKDVKKYIYQESFELLKCKELYEGDLLICRLAEPAGRACIFPKLDELKVITSVDVTIFRPSHDVVNRQYLNQVFTTQKWFNTVSENCGGTTHKRISRGALGKLLVPLPNLIEQTAIATALSDMDNLIAGLEKLIEKKKAIKQGAMQELLRPKEGWVVTAVGELGKPYGGLSGKSKIDFMEGTSPYIPFMNIMSNPIIDVNYFDFVKIRPSEIQNKVEVGDLLFNGSSETPEEVGMCSVLLNNVSGLYLNSFCFGFRPHSDKATNSLYLAYFFRSSFGRKLFYSLAQGATRYNLSKANFMRMKISLPPLAEQNKIELILRDMNDEIKGVEKELVKCKLLKQGMMQELLTGKTRLV